MTSHQPEQSHALPLFNTLSLDPYVSVQFENFFFLTIITTCYNIIHCRLCKCRSMLKLDFMTGIDGIVVTYLNLFCLSFTTIRNDQNRDYLKLLFFSDLSICVCFLMQIFVSFKINTKTKSISNINFNVYFMQLKALLHQNVRKN